ncbi:MAG: Trk system potassium transporter TrkA [Alphaproteobacteria bacterium]|nr:Trk system potassium transporter TrkA [Alphaproteobacteria bacterium]
MRVIVGGAGQVGMHLIDFLVNEGSDVIVLDSDQERIRQINDKYDVQAIVGHISDPEALEAAGASAETDIMISVAQSDEVNMVASQIAHSVFGIQTKIARIRRRSYQESYFQALFDDKIFPIDHVIWPEMETAEAICMSLAIPGAAEAISLCDGIVELISLHLNENCPILNEPLRQLTDRFSDLPITITAIVRGEEVLVPSAQDVFRKGDQIYFCTDREYIPAALFTFGYEAKPLERVLIVGGGQIASELALKLIAEHSDIKIRIIEKSAQQAREVSQKMQGRAMVIRGDAMDIQILEEAGIDRCDTVLSLTNHEETNILLALLAKRKGIDRVASLINHSDYFPLLKALGVDMVVSPREITASNILRHLRSGHVHQAHSIAGGQAEVIESEISRNAPVCGKTIQEAQFPRKTIVGAVIRNQKMLVPKPDMRLLEGDHIVVLAHRSVVRKLQNKITPFHHQT